MGARIVDYLVHVISGMAFLSCIPSHEGHPFSCPVQRDGCSHRQLFNREPTPLAAFAAYLFDDFRDGETPKRIP
jgi:hypothetical protein